MDALPNAAEASLAEAIRRLGKPGFETALDGLFRRAAAIDNLLILAYADRGPPQVLFRRADLPRVFAEIDSTYLTGAYRLDPFYDLHRARAPSGLYRLIDIAPDAFPRSRYYNEYYRQTTLVDELTFVAYPRPGVSLNLCLGRDAASGQRFAHREITTCTRLAPIVAALVQSHWAGLAPTLGPAEDLVGVLIRAAEAEHGLKLTPRQAEVALLILRGHSTASIGLSLGISPQTVKVFRKQLYTRCGISSQGELFALMMPLLKVGT